MTEAETANVLMQVVSGLLYLKANNILHRDLSLSNLLLTKDFKVKIADFGLATQLTGPNEKHMTLCGTPNYISPEVATRASHGHPVDVWGLGCMMYTLLVGTPPFDTNNVKRTLTGIVMSDYEVPAYLSTDAKDLINRLLEKNPKKRIRIDDVLEHPFMTKYTMPSTLKYNNTIASVDSGLITMSSDAVSTQNLTARLGARSHSEDHHYNYTSPNQLSNNGRGLLHSENNMFAMHPPLSDQIRHQNFNKQFNYQQFGLDAPNNINGFEGIKLVGSRTDEHMMENFSCDPFDGKENLLRRNGSDDPGGGSVGFCGNAHYMEITVCLPFLTLNQNNVKTCLKIFFCRKINHRLRTILNRNA